MMPAYEDLLRIQAIEVNDMIRKSQYSFEISNNIVRFMPIFQRETVIWFDYMVVSDKQSAMVEASGSVSDLSNVPYTRMSYDEINAMSRTWIFKYTLATAKELLGIIRSKFENIPYPDGQIRLDGELLRREGIAEKEVLIKELRDTLEQTGLQAQLKKQSENAIAMQDIFKRIPLMIYIG